MSKKYYFIGMSQKDMFKNQVLEEILRERKTYYTIKKHEIDFWIVISPDFLNSIETKERILETNYYKKLNYNSEKMFVEPFSCIVSMNKEFLEWIKLRLGYFENINLNKGSFENFYQSNGIYGELENFSPYNNNPLKSNNYNLDKNILGNKFSKVLENLSVS